MTDKLKWWEEDYGFFGDFYIEGDNSKEGYRVSAKQNLDERTKVEVGGVVSLLGLKENAKILDCPCGYGRHSIELSKRGFSVTGVDINSKHLSVAKQKARENNLGANFIKDSMLDIEFDSEFDAVINMFYSFGFFEKEEDNLKVLQNFFNALKPGGKFLMHTDVNIPFVIAGKYKHDEVRELENGNKLRIIDNYNQKTKRIDGAWIIKNDKGEETRKDYSVRVYTKEEFVELCYKAGFSSCEAYSDWDFTDYSEDSEDMIIVATK